MTSRICWLNISRFRQTVLLFRCKIGLRMTKALPLIHLIRLLKCYARKFWELRTGKSCKNPSDTTIFLRICFGLKKNYCILQFSFQNIRNHFKQQINDIICKIPYSFCQEWKDPGHRTIQTIALYVPHIPGVQKQNIFFFT